MPAKTHTSRIELLEAEFSSRGMHPSAAADLACHLVINHPVAQRFGMQKLTDEIISHGMGIDDADETARVLLAIELMDRGADFDKMMGELERYDVTGGDALAAALDGSRIHRATGSSDESTTELTAHLLTGITAIAIATLAMSFLLRLAIQ